MNRILTLACALAALLPDTLLAHDHYYAGIVDANGNNLPDAGEKLQFVGASGTNRTFHLLPRPLGHRPLQRCGGFYMLDENPRTLHSADAFSFAALSSGIIEPAAPGHARAGSWIWMEIVSVSGPPGAKFGFWEEGRSASFDTPTVSFPTNQPTGNYAFVLSEGFDAAGEDPQGHIHGRAWTADTPGDYYVGFRLVDRSTNRPGGLPWHTPSDVYVYHYQAGPSFQPAGQLVSGTGYVLTWPSKMGIFAAQTSQVGISFEIQRATSLSPSDWQTIGTVVGTTADTASFTDPSPPNGNALYRLRYLWNPAASPIPPQFSPALQSSVSPAQTSRNPKRKLKRNARPFKVRKDK